MRIEDEALLQVFRGRACEWCNEPPRSEAHHVYKRGMGGGARLDVPLNVLSVCRGCHERCEDGIIPLWTQWQLVADREGLESGTVAQEAVWRLLRSKK